ncbi:MAG: EI24 domain-containing protein [Campylobacterota bacterium]|nr:EI24 domain-containing protein [Campylobacterota bacterium]
MMTHTLGKSFKDIISIDTLIFVFKVTLISLALTAGLLWLFGGSLNGFVGSYLSWLPWEWLQTTGASVASVAIAYMLFIVTISIVTSFMVEPLLIKLAKKHYPEVKVIGTPNITTSILLSLKSAMIFLILFMFTFPIMFIPLVGAVYILWLWSILLKAPTIYDVSTLFIADKKEIKRRTKKSTLFAMIAAGFNYIPVLNVFAAVFAQIVFLHHILSEDA